MKRINGQRALQLLINGLWIYLAYVLIMGVLIFAIPSSNHGNNDLIDSDRFYDDSVGPDEVVLLHDSQLSKLARMDLIERAQDKISAAYFSIHQDDSAGLIFGSLLNAADRGVKVRLLIDGRPRNLIAGLNVHYQALTTHESIKIRYYEPVNPLMPWTFNNRLHDKYLIVDDAYAIIGGRNIGEQYFSSGTHDSISDKDVLIINGATDHNASDPSVIHEMNDYFDIQWEHPSAKCFGSVIKRLALLRVAGNRDQIARLVELDHQKRPEDVTENIDWSLLSVPTNKISFIHNPLQRTKKVPMVLKEIAALMERAEDSIIILCPYVVPTNEMMRYFKWSDFYASIILLTNSPSSSPNLFASAGYLNKKTKIKDATEMLYESNGNNGVHGKVFVIDERISIVGSFNLDARSAFLSTESMVVIDSPEFAGALKKEIFEIIAGNPPSTSLSWMEKIDLGIHRLLAYLFDFML